MSKGRSRNRANIIASRLKAFAFFSDSFTSSLSNSWKIRRGTWTSNSNKASTSTIASDYPLATVKMSKANVTAQIQSADQGAGIALWVTDSGNWWGVATGTSGATNCNCSTCNYYACNASTTNCNSFGCLGGNTDCTSATYPNCNGGVTDCTAYGYYCASYNAYNSKNKTGGNCALYQLRCNAYSFYCYMGWNSYQCNAYTYTCNSGYGCTSYSTTCTSSYSYSYSCNCSTCYPPFIRILQSVSNTVSEIYKWTLSSAANSLKVITSGTSITAKAYSDNNLSTQIDSDFTYTANGATIETTFGIMVAPSSYAQGNSLDDFSVTTN